MLNNIWIDGIKVIKVYKKGRNTFWLLNNECILKSGDLKKIEIECEDCLDRIKRPYRSSFLNKKYICQSCVVKGENNPFYGKTHSHEFRTKISNINKNHKYWVGKTHSKEAKEKLSKFGKTLIGKNNPFYGKTHSSETKEKLRISSKKWALNNPEKMSSRGIKSIEKQLEGRKTIPEKLVEDELKRRKWKFKYSKIIKDVGQFDFHLDSSILLEVHGDYWHANPLFYGDKLKPLNDRQKYKISRDKEKKEKVECMGFKLYSIWENDIKNNNFDVLDKIWKNIN